MLEKRFDLLAALTMTAGGFFTNGGIFRTADLDREEESVTKCEL